MDYGKLLNLLNEFETTLDPNEQIERTENGVKTTPLIVISNEYGFIKRLVENDKIDYNKIKEGGIKHNGKMDVDGLYRYSVYERVLMLLSISNSPIEDLVSYLK